MKKVALTLLFLLLIAPAVYAGHGIVHKKPGAELVKDSYIVLFHDGEQNPAARANELARLYGGTANYVYRHALKGAHFLITEGQARGMAHGPARRPRAVGRARLHCRRPGLLGHRLRRADRRGGSRLLMQQLVFEQHAGAFGSRPIAGCLPFWLSMEGTGCSAV